MKLILISLIALSTIRAYAQVASPTPTPTVDEQIEQAQKQLQLEKIKHEIWALDNPTPAPAPVIITNNNNNNNNTAAPAPAPVVAPVIVIEPTPVPVVQPTPVPVAQDQYPTEMRWILQINDAINNHNGRWLTQFTSGSVNYFGHVKTSDSYILWDMSNDANTYLTGRSTYDPNTFRHDVSNEYSPRWTGPMLYDSITLYTEIQARNGYIHRVNKRFTVGYTYISNVATIYALVIKVL